MGDFKFDYNELLEKQKNHNLIKELRNLYPNSKFDYIELRKHLSKHFKPLPPNFERISNKRLNS